MTVPNAHLAPSEDPELSELLAGYLRDEGIEVYTSAPVTSLRKEGHESVVRATVDGDDREFRADEVLVAAGRVGNTDQLDLAAAGVASAERGFVTVDVA